MKYLHKLQIFLESESGSLMGNKELILGKTNHVFKPISEDLE